MKHSGSVPGVGFGCNYFDKRGDRTDLTALCSQRNFVGPAAVEVADTGTKEGSAVTASAVKAGAEFGVIIDCFAGSEERGKWGTYSDTRVAWLYKGCLMVHKSCLAGVSGL